MVAAVSGGSGAGEGPRGGREALAAGAVVVVVASDMDAACAELN
jgi:hypothetical protein